MARFEVSSSSQFADVPGDTTELIIDQVADIDALPGLVCELQQLRRLSISQCHRLLTLPTNISSLLQLEELVVALCLSFSSLPDGIGALSCLTKLVVRYSSLAALPESLGQLSGLQQLNLSGCSSLAALPESLGQLSGLQQLNLSGCSSLAALPESVRQLSGLQQLNLSGCSSLAALPESLGQLSGLQQLNLSGCSSLAALPESLGQLSGLQQLNLSGCSSLAALPESVRQLSSLQQLDLSGCSLLAALPEWLGQLCGLRQLDLRGCSSLAALPESLGQLSGLQNLGLSGCRSLQQLPNSSRQLRLCQLDLRYCPLYEPSWLEQQCAAAITSILQRQQQRAARINLIKQQQNTMLETLERMSWLPLLLATATFLAFLQPPGGYDDATHQVLVGSPAACKAPPKATNSSSLHVALPYAYQDCSLFLFFVFDTLSFICALGCVMVIVVLSMPRQSRHQDDGPEAGRIWLGLLSTWLLLFLAVLSGYAAFAMSALAMFSGAVPTLVVLLAVGLSVFLWGGWRIAREVCVSVFPGWRSVLQGFRWRQGSPLAWGFEIVDGNGTADVESGQLVTVEDGFWERAEQAVAAGCSRAMMPFKPAAPTGVDAGDAAPAGSGRGGETELQPLLHNLRATDSLISRV